MAGKEAVATPVSPRANNHLALLACDRRLALLANSHVAVERPLRQDVVPPTKRVYRNPDRLEALFDAQGSPVVVVGRMLKPILIKLRMAAGQCLHILQGQMPKNLSEAQFLYPVLHGMHAGVLHNAGFLSNRAPPKRERQPESSVEGDRIAVGVGGSEVGKDGY